ncbi:DDE-domain-containing protein [Patellaria atrata CBS 101060]|uniref:DDE-domain-containing protein n=1 Tax=Patellaria atrata CBS 101060 TaxID=1346257 RepID=A0A9P4VQL5_9PEZI|nr:DDE-domain-containing protein [Patellaria atrata CBS 101060]
MRQDVLYGSSVTSEVKFKTVTSKSIGITGSMGSRHVISVLVVPFRRPRATIPLVMHSLSSCGRNTGIQPSDIQPPCVTLNFTNIQDVWLQDYKLKEHNVSFASSPTCWTNNHLGMEWLTNVFEPQTKAKARQARDWRLLLVDGHGSHLTLPFVDYCIKHRIILANFPPHSTHKLQPLDVSLLSPLSTYYRQELDKLKSHSEGRYTVTKRDFIRLFLPAFEKAFVPKNILSGFAKTGIQPFNPTAILKIFEEVDVPAGPVDQELSSDESEINTSDWRTIKRRLKEEFGPTPDLKTQKLSDTLLLAINENQSLKHRIKGLEETLDLEKQKRKRGKPIFKTAGMKLNSKSTFWTPAKVSRALDAIRRQETASKAEDKVRKEVTKAEKQKELDERRRLQAQDKADRQAKAAAERERFSAFS